MIEQNSKMSGIEEVEQGQKPRTSKLAVLSLVLVALGFCVSLCFVILMEKPFFSWHPFYIIWWFLSLIGLVFSVVALGEVSESNGRVTGVVFAKLGIGVAVISLIFLDVCFLVTPVKRLPPAVVCASHLHSLGKVMLIYANDFGGKYPTADKWCDLLMKHGEGELTEKSFRCPANKKERCSFAINPNCEPNSPEDVVLLFESRGGWNQYGGPELLAPENHEGRGCNILFNDGHVYFENVKSIPKLNWGDEKGEK